MTELTRKVCIVGDFAVGKTSTVERFVNNHFSDKYLTTVGVKVDTTRVELADRDASVKLVIWDVAGAEKFGAKELAYLRGSSGNVFVVDGSRSSTVESALALREQIQERYGEQPNVLLLNKADLESVWQIRDSHIATLSEAFDEIYRTSAKSGLNVELALRDLAAAVVDAELA